MALAAIPVAAWAQLPVPEGIDAPSPAAPGETRPTPFDTSWPAGSSEAAVVDLQQQVNELRSDLLDEREKRIDGASLSGVLVTLVLGMSLGIGMILAYAVYRIARARAGMGAATAFGLAEEPPDLFLRAGVPGLPASQTLPYRLPVGPETPSGDPARPAGPLRVLAPVTNGIDGTRASETGPSGGRLPGSDAWPDRATTAAGAPYDAEAAERHGLEETIADCTEAIRLDALDPRLYLERGQAYAQLGRYDKALGDFDRSIDLDPDNAAAYLSRSDARSQAGLHEEALEDFDRAFQLDPDMDAPPGDP